ncbi:unnamed protein product [Amoebophrya sp. A25]|nr:unnamed protein product [Amoebophrya sp. A25]|eukprot:GSA25T00001278001.1
MVEITEGREYVEVEDIQRILLSKRQYYFSVLSLLGNLIWVDVGRGSRSAFSWCGLLRFLRWEAVRKERKQASQGGVVISPYRQGVWASVELVFVMFYMVHLFAVAWFYVLYETDRGSTYACDEVERPIWKFYILALRDAILLFSASPPNSMIDRDDDVGIVLCVTLLRPVGAFAEAVIFARVVLIEQRMMILKSKTMEQQAAINAAMTQIKLPENLHKRINMYHQFLEIQHDKQACDLLYNTSSKALALEIKICLFAQLIEKAPFFRDLHPSGVGEILDNFEEEVFSPGDYIIRFGQEGFEMYFILRGLCDVVVIRKNSMQQAGPNALPLSRNKLVVAQKREGDYFGETALVQKGQKRTAYVRAQTYTVAEKLTADALNNIVKKKFPEAYAQIVYRISQFHQIAPTKEQKEEVVLLREPSLDLSAAPEQSSSFLMKSEPLRGSVAVRRSASGSMGGGAMQSVSVGAGISGAVGAGVGGGNAASMNFGAGSMNFGGLTGPQGGGPLGLQQQHSLSAGASFASGASSAAIYNWHQRGAGIPSNSGAGGVGGGGLGAGGLSGGVQSGVSSSSSLVNLNNTTASSMNNNINISSTAGLIQMNSPPAAHAVSGGPTPGASLGGSHVGGGVPLPNTYLPHSSGQNLVPSGGSSSEQLAGTAARPRSSAPPVILGGGGVAAGNSIGGVLATSGGLQAGGLDPSSGLTSNPGGVNTGDFPSNTSPSSLAVGVDVSAAPSFPAPEPAPSSHSQSHEPTPSTSAVSSNQTGNTAIASASNIINNSTLLQVAQAAPPGGGDTPEFIPSSSTMTSAFRTAATALSTSSVLQQGGSTGSTLEAPDDPGNDPLQPRSGSFAGVSSPSGRPRSLSAVVPPVAQPQQIQEHEMHLVHQGTSGGGASGVYNNNQPQHQLHINYQTTSTLGPLQQLQQHPEQSPPSGGMSSHGGGGRIYGAGGGGATSSGGGNARQHTTGGGGGSQQHGLQQHGGASSSSSTDAGLTHLLSEQHIRGSSDLYSTTDFLRSSMAAQQAIDPEAEQQTASSRSLLEAAKIGTQLKKIFRRRSKSPTDNG